MYVHKDSNHPPAVIKNLPTSINRRLSSISANETVFDESVKIHQEALEKSGYTQKLKFEQPVINPNRRKNLQLFQEQTVPTRPEVSDERTCVQCYRHPSSL